MILFTLALLLQVVLSKGPVGYDLWAGIFAAQWMKFLTFSVIIALPCTPGSVCATSGWTTSSPWDYAWYCKSSPSSGSSAAQAGASRFCGVCDAHAQFREQRLNP